MLIVAVVVVAIVVVAMIAVGSSLSFYWSVGCAGCLVADHFLVVGLIVAAVGFAEKVG